MIGPKSPRSCPMGVFDVEDVPKLGKRAVVVPGILRSFEILKAGKHCEEKLETSCGKTNVSKCTVCLKEV